MLVRFRETAAGLQGSLVETRRIDGKVRYEHVASLGSVPASPSVADRIAFWRRVYETLAELANQKAGAKRPAAASPHYAGTRLGPVVRVVCGKSENNSCARAGAFRLGAFSANPAAATFAWPQPSIGGRRSRVDWRL
jgi:hypothetical protein